MKATLRIPQHHIRLHYENEQIEFTCREDESIARAAQRAGFALTVGCMQSRCMTCRAKLKQGAVQSTRPLSRYATIDPAAIDGGYVLLCSVTAKQNLILEPASCWVLPQASLEENE